MLQIYALAPVTVRTYLMRTFWRFQTIVTLSFLAFGAFLASAGPPIQWIAAGPILLVTALAYFLAIFLHYRRQMRHLYSVRVELDGSSIAYRQAGHPPHRIMRAAILQTRELKDGLLIETDDTRMDLFVPFGLSRDGDSSVRKALAEWAEFLPLRKASSANSWLAMAGMAAALAILLFANSLWLLVALGLALFIYGTYLETRLQRSGMVAIGTARMITMAFTFVIFVIVMKACFLSISLLVR